MGDEALLFIRLADEHSAVGQRQRRRAVKKGRRDDMRARIERAHMLR